MENKQLKADDVLSSFSTSGVKFTASDFSIASKISRPYANIILSKLLKEGKVSRFGSARSTYYIAGLNYSHTFNNINLDEAEVLAKVLHADSRYLKLSEHVRSIVEYAFLEMCNNAIEHSRGTKIEISFSVADSVDFEIKDNGIGVFRNIKEKRKLNSELEAVQDLLKGKTTTAPALHSGEGIFFTSKVAESFSLISYDYVLIIDNEIHDIGFGKNDTEVVGTLVKFSLPVNTTTHLSDIFKEYSMLGEDGIPSFDTTLVVISLYQNGGTFISRSQARRVLTGLEKFQNIIFDFNKVPMIGQAFADEVFRVFPSKQPGIKVEYRNANDAVDFMIKRAINTVR